MTIEEYEDGTEEFGGATEGVEWAGTHTLNRGQMQARYKRKLYTAEESDLPLYPPPGYDENDGEWVLDDPPFSFVSREVEVRPELDVAETTQGMNSGSDDSNKIWNLAGTCRTYFNATTEGRERKWVIAEMPVNGYSEIWAYVVIQRQGPVGGEIAEEVHVVGEVPMMSTSKHRIGEFVLNE